MITGFNTDIDYDGVTYHVQTEDKGLDNPLILSLVYVGGAILASKRVPYTDLVAKGFDEKSLTERLQRQHKLICAAIRAGRIDDLKKMNEQREGAAAAVPAPATIEPEVVEKPARREPPARKEMAPPPVLTTEQVQILGRATSILDLITDPSVPIMPEGIVLLRSDPAPVETTEPAAVPFTLTEEDIVPAELAAAEGEELYLKLLDDEGDFRAGQLATIKIYVGRGTFGRRAVAEASVTVKVLGTSFRPLILATRTDAEGVAVVRALLPQFNSGRAAILIRATDALGGEAELRRIIHQS